MEAGFRTEFGTLLTPAVILYASNAWLQAQWARAYIRPGKKHDRDPDTSPPIPHVPDKHHHTRREIGNVGWRVGVSRLLGIACLRKKLKTNRNYFKASSQTIC